MTGHITGSALVLSEDLSHVLLIHHLALDRWLQPGGHVELADTLLESAIREVAEETGVLHVIPFGVKPGTPASEVVPFDIDTHLIPANLKKREGEHWHHDFVYLLQVQGPVELVIQPEEIKGIRWEPVSHLASLGSPRFDRMARKLAQLS